MNSKRMFWLLSGLVIIFLVATLAGAYELSGVFEKQSNKLADAKAKLASLNQEKIDLAQAKKDINTYQDLYNIARTIVPQNKDQAEAVRQIVKLAGQAGVTIDSITFPPSTLGGSGAAAPSTGAASAAPSAAGGNSSLSQLKAVPKIPGVYQLELNVTSSTDPNKLVTYSELINFLRGLEQNRLTALVSAISITPSANTSPNVSVISNTRFELGLTLDI